MENFIFQNIIFISVAACTEWLQMGTRRVCVWVCVCVFESAISFKKGTKYRNDVNFSSKVPLFIAIPNIAHLNVITIRP